MNLRLCFFLCFLSFHIGVLDAKIRLLTFHYNKPDFIEMQYRTLKKFMKEDYELIVFNDARTIENETAIRVTCEQLGIQCIRFYQMWHEKDPLNQYLLEVLSQPNVHSHIGFNTCTLECISSQLSVRHCHVIQFALDYFGYDHDDLVVILDGDIFPIRPIDLRSMMSNHQMMGIYKYIAENDVAYFWVPFICMNMPMMPNKNDLKFHVDLIDDYIFDSGAHSYHYLKNNPRLKTKKYSWLSSSLYHYYSTKQLRKMGFTKLEAKFIQDLPWPQSVEFHLDKHFLHFAGSSFCLEGHNIKSDFVIEFLKKITE